MKTIIKKIDEDIYAIDQEMVRSFVIIGKKQALVFDTGVEHVDFLSFIQQIIRLPVILCLSHSDRDHIANVDQFDEVYIHEDEVSYLKKIKIKLNIVHEGDIFDLGDKKLEVIHTPGHTPGSICLWDRQHHQLFSGDTVSYGPVYMFGESRNMKDYVASLKKLNKMIDETNMIYPCHNTCPITKNVILQLLECINKMKSGKLIGQPSHISGVLLYSYKQCGILRIEDE